MQRNSIERKTGPLGLLFRRGIWRLQTLGDILWLLPKIPPLLGAMLKACYEDISFTSMLVSDDRTIYIWLHTSDQFLHSFSDAERETQD
jgi:hypothetical protein